MQIISGRADRRLDVPRGGASLPIVNVIENDFEVFPRESGLDGLRIIAVGDQILDPPPQVMARPAVQHRDGVALLQ